MVTTAIKVFCPRSSITVNDYVSISNLFTYKFPSLVKETVKSPSYS